MIGTVVPIKDGGLLLALENSVAVFDPEKCALGHRTEIRIDAEDRLWIAMFRGAGATCWDPQNGELLETIPVPAPNLTSCAFGGPDLTSMQGPFL